MASKLTAGDLQAITSAAAGIEVRGDRYQEKLEAMTGR